jgi:hypothetical protein
MIGCLVKISLSVILSAAQATASELVEYTVKSFLFLIKVFVIKGVGEWRYSSIFMPR